MSMALKDHLHLWRHGAEIAGSVSPRQHLPRKGNATISLVVQA